MADSEYNVNKYKSLKITIGAIIRSPEMLRFISDHVKYKDSV